MKYGIYLPTHTPFDRPQIIARLAQDAEQAGWDGVFIWDDITGSEGKDLADPWISLAAAAMITQRVALGALITPLARRRPWKVARETASLDHLSGGRMVFGVGVGSGDEQFDDLGEEPNQRLRGDMVDEGLEILTGLWSGEDFQYEGIHYHLKPTRFRPAPLQQPRIPIWVAGFWPNKRPLKRMARWDGMFPLFPPEGTPSEQQERLRQTVAAVKALRNDQRPFDVIMTGTTPANTPEQNREYTASFAQAGASWWLEWLEPMRLSDKPWEFEQLRERVLAGPVGQ
jgi:alkanesulfonate monooxygenase SsuD/methylene tetrahydromethanopterin reductase-like flavin-dependent oxidoreductase (luciferase family)